MKRFLQGLLLFAGFFMLQSLFSGQELPLEAKDLGVCGRMSGKDASTIKKKLLPSVINCSVHDIYIYTCAY
jgi:hypothetical protein